MLPVKKPDGQEAGMNPVIQAGQRSEAAVTPRYSHGARQCQLWKILFLSGYCICVFFLIAHHEVSRDEVRAYSIARAANDPIDLVRNQLVDEGHPALWYLILWLGSKVWDNYAVLKIASYLGGVGLVSVVFLAGPFPLLHRSLFALGTFPLFWFSVYCRSYGLAALLILLLAVEYTRKPLGNPWRVGGYNALLANTTVWGAIVACAFLLVPIDTTLGARYGRRPWFCVVVLLTVIGLALSLYTVSPTRDNLVIDKKGIQSLQAGYANLAGEAIRTASAILTDQQGWTGYILTGYGVRFKLSQLGFPLLATFSSIAGLAAILALFIKWPRILVAFGSCFVAGGVFSMLVYPASSYHIAVIAVFLFALLWVVWSRYYRAGSLYWRFVTYFLGFCLFSQASDGIRVAWASLQKPFSSSKVAGAFLKQAYSDAVVMCEPDAYGEALPYYADNPIYLVREGGFGKWVHFQRRFNRAITLGEVMDASTRMEKVSGKTVLVSLPKRIGEFQPGQFDLAYGRALEINEDELQRFRSDFHEVAAFTEGLETYVFYKHGTLP